VITFVSAMEFFHNYLLLHIWKAGFIRKLDSLNLRFIAREKEIIFTLCSRFSTLAIIDEICTRINVEHFQIKALFVD
jgi:hypothetical protein